MTTTVIFDLETVADESCWYDRPGIDAPKKPGRPRKSDGFAPLYAHQIACLGFMTVTDGVPAILNSLTATNLTEERGLLAAFGHFMGEHSPNIVTFNGRSFDVPVLSLRSYRHGLEQGWCTPDYRKKYSEGAHVDLKDVMTDFGTLGPTGYSLDVCARLIGLPGKGEVDGTMVGELYAKGEHEKIAAYCQRDVVQTAYVYFRYRLLRGHISRDQYRAAVAAIGALWVGRPEFESFDVDNERLLTVA